MPLSNAERQRRYRQKLKARASGEAVEEWVHTLARQAWRVLADLPEDPLRAPGGVARPLVEACRIALADSASLDGREAYVLHRILAIDAIINTGGPSNGP
jgi:hypothetical protein